MLEGKQGEGQVITDDTIRTIMVKLSPEIDVMIAQAVDKLMDERPRARPSEGSTSRRRRPNSNWDTSP